MCHIFARRGVRLWGHCAGPLCGPPSAARSFMTRFVSAVVDGKLPDQIPAVPKAEGRRQLRKRSYEAGGVLTRWGRVATLRGRWGRAWSAVSTGRRRRAVAQACLVRGGGGRPVDQGRYGIQQQRGTGNDDGGSRALAWRGPKPASGWRKEGVEGSERDPAKSDEDMYYAPGPGGRSQRLCSPIFSWPVVKPPPFFLFS